MKELTDLEICTRIAEIEGVNFTVNCEKTPTHILELVEKSHAIIKRRYDPLKFDALVFRLMIKHKISLINHIGTNSCYAIGGHSSTDTGECATNIISNPNKAICLAIIKANTEKAKAA